MYFKADMTAIFLFEVKASEHITYVNILPHGSAYTQYLQFVLGFVVNWWHHSVSTASSVLP